MNIDDITGAVRVEDLLEAHPKAQAFLFERGVVCVQCGEIFWGELQELVAEKKLDLDVILRDLKQFLQGE